MQPCSARRFRSCPESAQAKLRQFSVAARRAGAQQGILASFREVECSSGPLSKDQPLCADSMPVDARSVP